jgi:hypothetical protein
MKVIVIFFKNFVDTIVTKPQDWNVFSLNAVPNESSSNSLSNLNFETTIAYSNNLNMKSIPPFPTKHGFKLASLNIASLIKHIPGVPKKTCGVWVHVR